MTLETEIANARLKVHTDSYPMSIGEIINLYQDDEIDIHPEFQRIYRWTNAQKSKLIESILLGIPLPSFFVSQRDDGVWDVVDGLQRLSTILSFVGEYKDENGKPTAPLVLESTKYLPSLEGKVWSSSDNPESEIPKDIKRVFKREKIDLKIIKRESESDTKFELFQRLNTGGSKLSPQEVRNCILLMLNHSAFDWIKLLEENPDFMSCLPITSRQKKESYATELIIRFITYRHTSEDLRRNNQDIGDYLDAEINKLFATDSNFDYVSEKDIFDKTFSIFTESLGENSFKKFHQDKSRHEGAISVAVYEALTYGLSKFIEENPQERRESLILKTRAVSEALTAHTTFHSIISSQARPIDRFTRLNSLGRELFNEN